MAAADSDVIDPDLAEEDLPPPPDQMRSLEEPIPQQVAMAGVGASAAFARESMEREADETAHLLNKYIGTDSQGYVEIFREGPPEVPVTEKGRLGRIALRKLKDKPLEDLIKETWGGGEFRWFAKASDNTVIPRLGGRVEIAGEIEPFTPSGRKFVRDRRHEADGDDEDSPRRGKGGDGLYDLVATLARPTANPQDHAVSMITAIMSMNEKMRADSERERERWREDQRKEDERRATAREDERKERERERNEEHKRQMAEITAKNKADIEQAKESTKNLFALQMELIKQQAAGGLGLDGLKKIREAVAEIGVSQIKDALSDGGGDGGGFKDAIVDVVRKDGGEILKSVLHILGTKMGVAPQPAGLPEPQSAIELEDDDVQATPTAEAAQQPEAPPPDSVAAAQQSATPPATSEQLPPSTQIAMKKIAPRVIAFVTLLSSEMQLQTDPHSAWDSDQGEEPSLRELFGELPMAARQSLARGWNEFVKVSAPYARAALEEVAKLAKADPVRKAWLRAFLSSPVAPWGSEDEDDEGPPSAPGAPPAVAAPPVVGEAVVGAPAPQDDEASDEGDDEATGG